MTDWHEIGAPRLRELVKQAGVTQPELVDGSGIPIATLQRILSGKTDPGRDRLARIASVLGRSPDDILASDASPSREARVPIYDIEVAAGAGRYTFDGTRPVGHWPFPVAWLAQFGGGANLKLVTVAGDSQEPELGDGDMVMIDTASTRLRDGMHVVRLDDALLIKRVQLQGSTVLLKSANAAYDDIVVDRSTDADQFEIVGRAVWAGRML